MRDTFGICGKADTVFPPSWQPGWKRAEIVAATALGQQLFADNPLRNVTAVYLHGAGIEAGYGFFAPNVPANYKVVFEITYPDGRVEYDIPTVQSAAAGLRLAGLLDAIAETEYEPLREFMLKVMTYSIWQEHPKATRIRTVLGLATLATVDELARGGKGSYEMLYAYDFSFRPPEPRPNDH